MKKTKGFTLIELLVVIAIIGMLSAVVLTSVTSARTKASIAAGKQFDSSVHQSIGDRLIGEWTFDDGSGSTAKDTSGYGHDGTVNAGVTWTTGVIRNALDFNGTAIGNVSIGSIGAFPTQGTLSYWMYSRDDGSTIAYSNVMQTDGGNIGIRFEQNGRFYAYICDSFGLNCGLHTITNPMSINKWYQVTIVWDTSANKVQGYLNGVKVFDDAQTGWPTTLGNVVVGYGLNSSRPFNGVVDEVRIYASNLTATNIQNMYAVEKPKHVDGLAMVGK